MNARTRARATFHDLSSANFRKEERERKTKEKERNVKDKRERIWERKTFCQGPMSASNFVLTDFVLDLNQ